MHYQEFYVVIPGSRKPESLAPAGFQLAGTLDSQSNILCGDKSFFNVYTLDGKAGQRFTIDIESQEFAPVLMMISPDETVFAKNINPESSHKASLEIQLPADGRYVVIANSTQGRQKGTYRIDGRLR